MFKGLLVMENVFVEWYIYVLFKNKFCKFLIVNVFYMYKVVIFNIENLDIGCWGKMFDVSNVEVLIIGLYGYKSMVVLIEFYLVIFDKDGMGYFKGWVMSFDEYFSNIKKL